jgi:hypothetical protein
MMTIWYSKRTFLAIVVIVIGLNLGIYWIRSIAHEASQAYRAVGTANKSERNERSTPRNFILPATPAVAVEQEMRSSSYSDVALSRRQLAVCAVRLIDLGYDVGDEPVAFNAKLSQAIYEYQEVHDLNKTGKLDPATIRSLSCRVN